VTLYQLLAGSDGITFKCARWWRGRLECWPQRPIHWPLHRARHLSLDRLSAV